MNKNLSWRELKALNSLYANGSTKARVQQHPYIIHLFQEKGLLDHGFGNTKILKAVDNFSEYYEANLKESFSIYKEFFGRYDFLTPQSSFKERDIRVLILIDEQKEQINEVCYSRKKFSSQFFEDSKYLKADSALEKAVLNILGIESFQGTDPKDQQYRLVLDCKNPSRIVLCENIDFLLYPDLARENNIWLWYVGGNNIKKLDHLPSIELPIYYSCDWDYHGLKIYQDIKIKIPQIVLLFPNAINLRKPVNSLNHRSCWRHDLPFSGLRREPHFYSDEAIKVVELLIQNEEWIEEESNDLCKMLEVAGDLQL